MASLKEGEWSCYRGGKFNGGSGHVTEVARLRENGHVTEVVFNGGRHDHVTEEVSIMEREWSCYGGGQFK